MKTLCLVRHAKSDKGNLLLKDIDRPLNDRGYRDAYTMSKKLMSDGFIPDLIITSPAVRAYSTAHIFKNTFGLTNVNFVLKDSLYYENAENYMEAVRTIYNQFNSVMMFGHNPTISETANILSGETMDDFPTCGILCLDFGIKSWEEISNAGGIPRFFEFPKK